MKKSLYALVIDDEPQLSGFVSQILQSDGWNVSEARTADEAFNLRLAKDWSLVFCDVVLGGTDGYEVLRRYSEELPNARFVLMTGHGSAVGALDATAIGAYDYLVKPFSVDDILIIAQAVREQQNTPWKKKKTTETLTEGYVSDIPLIGRSPKFVECLKMVGRVSNTNLPVLITGESGTGKEVVARAIHQRSKRAGHSFVAVNCGAVPVDLIESELFGHAKGSFTGADRERMGLWEEADGGTILLDEITETNPLFQVKLLRALQQGEIRRVGSNRTVKVDVRAIAATNCDIEEEVREGRFRQDLMYRLNAVTIHLPPLRERVEDIPLLAEHFGRKVLGHNGRPIKFSPAARDILASYAWPGNIRELENAILRAVSLSDDTIHPDHLPTRILDSAKRGAITHGDPLNGGPLPAAGAENVIIPLAEMEAKYVTQTLAHTGGNKQAAARLLNIDRKTLARIIKKYEQ